MNAKIFLQIYYVLIVCIICVSSNETLDYLEFGRSLKDHNVKRKNRGYDYESRHDRNRGSIMKTQNSLRQDKMHSITRDNRDTNIDKQYEKMTCSQILRDVLFPPKEVYERCMRSGEIFPRIIGKRGTDGVFGFFINRHFFHCKPPLKTDIEINTTDTGEEIHYIPPDKNYYHKCQYYDEDPTRKQARKIGAKGLNGTFGYFERGIFVACEPPKSFEKVPEFDPKLNATVYVYIIPYEVSLEYPSKCEYFEENPGNKYNFNDTQTSGNGRRVYKMFHSVLHFLLYYVVIQTIHTFYYN